MFLRILVSFYVLSLIKANAVNKFMVEFEWNYINFTWPSAAKMDELDYHPEDYIPVGIKISDNLLFVALPRSKDRARITLATIPLNGKKKNPPLTPYPNWRMNTGTSCSSFQDVQSMEIDKDGIMWVLDARRVSKNTINCPPKIVLLNIKQGGEVIQSYDVPDELCPHRNGCFLNDIVVDGDFAYCSDTTSTDPGIFIYDKTRNTSWKARNNATMWGTNEASNFVAQGVDFKGVSHINGIALSPQCSQSKTFYYTPQTSHHIYAIDTAVLRKEILAKGDISEYITDVVTKPSATGGMIGDSVGNIYFGLIPDDAVAVKEPHKSKLKIVDKNSSIIKWPDTFAYDLNGWLYVSATQILRFNNVQMNLDEVNFRILKIFTGRKSYFYCQQKYCNSPTLT